MTDEAFPWVEIAPIAAPSSELSRGSAVLHTFTVINIDIGKDSFRVVGQDRRGGDGCVRFGNDVFQQWALQDGLIAMDCAAHHVSTNPDAARR
jgi:hypothetical protein